MAVKMSQLVGDLNDETEQLVRILSDLDDAAWELPTPAAGWAIRDQVSHLAYFDETATLAAVDAEKFRADSAALREEGDAFPDRVAGWYREMPVPTLFGWFRKARQQLLATFLDLDPKKRLPWYGPDMSAASSMTARLMETWAHGQDIADALGVTRTPTDRLRSVAHLGVSTFGFSHQLNKIDVPEVPVRVELVAPSGEHWSWGPDDAADRVSGPALDFCLAVTQRRHRDDTALRVEGSHAERWMSIAQAFAGAPGPGRTPGQFAERSTS